MYFQNPGENESILEYLLLESIGAKRAGGMFAWANLNGIKSFIEDDIFVDFLQANEFRLLLGTDLITDSRAVTRLQELEDRHPNLHVRAFVHEAPSKTFHPKVAWFEHSNSTTVITGSGNLTLSGLKSNWEGFTIQRLSKEDSDLFDGRVSNFYHQNTDYIYPIRSHVVEDRAARNLPPTGSSAKVLTTTRDQSRAVDSSDSLLVAEIPRAGNRWNQANFSKDYYEGFFGAKVGSQRRISLFHVDEQGNLGELESRPSVEVQSRNYRFELSAANGIDYPDDGPPIGVFLRVESGVVLYTLLLPESPGYPQAQAFLSQKWDGSPRHMRRVVHPPEDLRGQWPDAPLWDAPMPEL